MKKIQPNVLFLFSDQHKASVLGCENHPDVRTPHIDKLASEGTRFARDWGAEWGYAPPGSIRDGQPRPCAPLSAQVSELPPDATMEAFTAQHTIDYLQRRAADGQPFFCWANFIRPHQPYTPPKKYMERFDTSKWGKGANSNDGIAKPAGFDEPADHLPPELRKQRESVDGTWCLKRCHEDEQLFDRETDPFEQSNCIHDPDLEDISLGLESQLSDWMADTSAEGKIALGGQSTTITLP